MSPKTLYSLSPDLILMMHYMEFDHNWPTDFRDRYFENVDGHKDARRMEWKSDQ